MNFQPFAMGRLNHVLQGIKAGIIGGIGQGRLK